MKLFLILLIMGLFLITGCTEQLLSVEEKEAIGSLEGEEGSLTGQAVNTNTCKSKAIWGFFFTFRGNL